MSMRYTRQPDGTYISSGDLPVGTKTVKLHIDGKPSVGPARNAKEYVAYLNEMIASGAPMKAQVYELVPVAVLSSERISTLTSQLVKAREVKKARRA